LVRNTHKGRNKGKKRRCLGTPTGAEKKIEMEKPEVIIADKTFHPDLQDSLTEKIKSITGYSPKIFFVGTYLQEREGSFIYTLKRDYYKKNYHKSPSDFWEEIIQYLKDLFK
jgi:hypothetical protein